MKHTKLTSNSRHVECWVRVFRVLKRRHVVENLGKVISCNFHHIHQHPLKLISLHPHLITTRTWKESIHLHKCPALAMSLASETSFPHPQPPFPPSWPSHVEVTPPGCIVPINAVQCCYQQSNCQRLRFQPRQPGQLPSERTKDDCFIWTSRKIMLYLCYSFEE